MCAEDQADLGVKMMKKLFIPSVLLLTFWALPIQADFFLCTPNCGGGPPNSFPNSDLMVGNADNNSISGRGGNDVIFAKEGDDTLRGNEDNDLLFGDFGIDDLGGGDGIDTLLPGPDDFGGMQESLGDDGNDQFIVLVGETVNCQEIDGGRDFDTVHLIGFGPYVAEHPYGAPRPIGPTSWIVVQDPVANGYIFIRVEEDLDDDSTERITGLPSPNVAVLSTAEGDIFRNANCQIQE
jgi:hypothetical protein